MFAFKLNSLIYCPSPEERIHHIEDKHDVIYPQFELFSPFLNPPVVSAKNTI